MWVQGQEDPLEQDMAGHNNPLQYSCLENPVDRGAWRATSVGLQSRTQLKRFSTAWLISGC